MLLFALDRAHPRPMDVVTLFVCDIDLQKSQSMNKEKPTKGQAILKKVSEQDVQVVDVKLMQNRSLGPAKLDQEGKPHKVFQSPKPSPPRVNSKTLFNFHGQILSPLPKKLPIGPCSDTGMIGLQMYTHPSVQLHCTMCISCKSTI